VLKREVVKINMDGKGRFMDNIFIERRSLKYEEVLIKAYASVAEARAGIGAYLAFYNDERPHQSFKYQTPRQVFDAGLWTCGRSASPVLPPCLRPRPETWGNARLRPHAPQQQPEIYRPEKKKGLQSFASLPLIRVNVSMTPAGFSLNSAPPLSKQWSPSQL